jgi:ubiquinone/menaquinone biosynthesis C-methylase UbiE
MSVPTNWYEDFFHGLALDLWRKAISPEQTKAEADFLVKALRVDKGSHLLDVPCGNGRLAFELAKRGYRVTGVDISDEFIAEAWSQLNPPSIDHPSAAAAPGTTAAGGIDSVEFLLGDMRRIGGEKLYDGALCFGNSFGFLEYADMEKFLKGIARTLKPGARFVIETGMAAESILPKFETETSHQVDDISVTIKERYLAEESCIDTEYVFERDEKSETRLAKHWIYTVAEIRRMLERAGFAVEAMFGSLDRKPHKLLGVTELFVVAQRI